MEDRLIGLEFLDSFLVSFYVFGVDFVLGSRRVEGAQSEENFDGALVFCRGQAFRAFSLELDRFLSVSYCERFQFF